VILFAHGHCLRDDHPYQRWFRLPAQLARSGYVVVVPELVGIDTHPSQAPGVQQVLADALVWIRASWERRANLMPEPATGLAGHSYGALHAGILATKIPAAGVVSLSGVWNDWDPSSQGPRPIYQIALPRLFTWGTDPDHGTETEAILSDVRWNGVALPKHRAVFTKAEHFDYLYGPKLPCRQTKGPCRYVGPATDDLVTMFFAKYLPPELWPNLPGLIPDNLVPPPLQLTPQQEFYAAGHLVGLKQFREDTHCQVAISEELSTDRVVPYVLNSPRNVAEHDVRERDLVPSFNTLAEQAGAPMPWVDSQHPAAGTVVAAGSTVQMGLHSGPVP
jgi:hypothetical protein